MFAATGWIWTIVRFNEMQWQELCFLLQTRPGKTKQQAVVAEKNDRSILLLL